jgi:uncharacterized protein YecT (DUF1311 family)
VRFIFLFLAISMLNACNPRESAQSKSVIEPAFECGKEPNNVEITACLEKQVQVSSTRVQKAFDRNLSEAADEDKEGVEFEGPSNTFDPNTHVKAVKSSQDAWEKYAEAQCMLEGYTALGGTAEHHFVLRCRDRLNLQRLKDLRSPFMLESQRLQPVPEE